VYFSLSLGSCASSFPYPPFFAPVGAHGHGQECVEFHQGKNERSEKGLVQGEPLARINAEQNLKRFAMSMVWKRRLATFMIRGAARPQNSGMWKI